MHLKALSGIYRQHCQALVPKMKSNNFPGYVNLFHALSESALFHALSDLQSPLHKAKGSESSGALAQRSAVLCKDNCFWSKKSFSELT